MSKSKKKLRIRKSISELAATLKRLTFGRKAEKNVDDRKLSIGSANSKFYVHTDTPEKTIEGMSLINNILFNYDVTLLFLNSFVN